MVDDELVTLAKQGSQDAWARLYALHAGRLLVWLGTLGTGDAAAAAEDVAAESWLVASQKIAVAPLSLRSFVTWSACRAVSSGTITEPEAIVPK